MLNKKALIGTASAPPVFVDDVFSTYLYTGTGATQTITNNIDLSGKGGLVWQKGRSSVSANTLIDTVRGGGNYLRSETTDAQVSTTALIFNNNGFTTQGTWQNTNSQTYASWTFREQPKFFDIVTYTGNGASGGRTISHNLGSAPGMIILKVTDLAGDDWYVYHRSIPTRVLALNSTNVTDPSPAQFVFGNGTTVVAPTSTNFTIGSTVNPNGYTFVAYLFAHDAGGFGTPGTDNVISCGTFTTATSTLDVTLGYEPQYVMFKRVDDAGDWQVYDNMRGFPNGRRLSPNTSAAEDAGAAIQALATGFNVNTTYNARFIYMAIRRPMKPPTSGTQVFNPTKSNAANGTPITTNFVVDSQWINYLPGTATNTAFNDRLRGVSTNATESGNYLRSASNAAEATALTYTNNWGNTGYLIPSATAFDNTVYYSFSRRPGFFDEVCYTGTGSNTTQAHNLNAVPELMIIKRRNAIDNWTVYAQPLGNTSRIFLNSSNGESTGQATTWNSTTPTSSVFSIGTNTGVNASGGTYVAYLFATLAGISKVGSYTGNGSTQAIACGFTGGARFVLIKRTDNTGDWYVYDTARGMTLLTDPYLLLNSTAAETATLGSVTTTTGGFTLNASILTAINTNGASYIFLAIS